MGRMLEALKALESRKTAVLEPSLAVPPSRQAPKIESIASDVEPIVDAPAPTAWQSTPSVAAFEPVCLPTTADVSDPYLQLADRVSEQIAANYCNVLLFVSPDYSSDACLSMTQLTQAVALQSPGGVLLVDGDLRRRRLSKLVCPSGPGVIEVMSGTAAWPQVIHPTNVARIDFVSGGTSTQVPTVERPQFGWSALRPQYRAVLIGVAAADDPATSWLAARCDGVYLVLSRPHTKRQTASKAVNALRSSGASVLGCVVADD